MAKFAYAVGGVTCAIPRELGQGQLRGRVVLEEGRRRLQEPLAGLVGLDLAQAGLGSGDRLGARDRLLARRWALLRHGLPGQRLNATRAILRRRTTLLGDIGHLTDFTIIKPSGKVCFALRSSSEPARDLMRTIRWVGLCAALGSMACTGKSNSSNSSITVAPAQAQVLTCDSLQLKATPGNATDAVQWSVQSGPGTVSDAGLYTAPTQASGSVSATVVATDTSSTSSASAALTVATAFPAAPVGIDGGASSGSHSFAHTAASNGSRVYAVTAGPPSLTPTALIIRSDDSGATWGAPVVAITATLPNANGNQGPASMDCMAVAVDPANPDLVYVWAFQDNETVEGDAVAGAPAGDTAFLAISKDGANTFSQVVMRVGSNRRSAGTSPHPPPTPSSSSRRREGSPT